MARIRAATCSGMAWPVKHGREEKYAFAVVGARCAQQGAAPGGRSLRAACVAGLA